MIHTQWLAGESVMLVINNIAVFVWWMSEWNVSLPLSLSLSTLHLDVAGQ